MWGCRWLAAATPCCGYVPGSEPSARRCVRCSGGRCVVVASVGWLRCHRDVRVRLDCRRRLPPRPRCGASSRRSRARRSFRWCCTGDEQPRFGAPFALPLEKQVFTTYDAQRQATLAANGGSLFGAKFVPTTLLQYARPDAVRFDSTFPFVNFPHHRAHVVGHVVFDTLDRSSSMPASMPGFSAPGVDRRVALLRGPEPESRRRRGGCCGRSCSAASCGSGSS